MTRRSRFLWLGVSVWLLMPIGAIANGAVRDLLLAPWLGTRLAEIAGVVMLLVFIYAMTAIFLWSAGGGRRPWDLWALGVLWMVLTIAFEALFFGLVMGVPASELVAAYDLLEGELWPLVVIGVLLAPPLVDSGLRRLPGAAPTIRSPRRPRGRALERSEAREPQREPPGVRAPGRARPGGTGAGRPRGLR